MDLFLMAQGIPVRVSDSEKGDKTIVLLHGYLETLEVWETFAAALSAHYRVVAIDIPGHGFSGVKSEEHSMEFIADVLHEVLQKLNITKSCIIGHSMGGYVALAYAAKYTGNTSGLCLFHSTPNADTDQKKADRDREIQLIRNNKLELIVRTNIARQFANENVERLADEIEEIQENALVASNEGIIACLNGMKNRADRNDFLKQFSKPALLIFGKKDNYISEEIAQTIIGRFPEAKSAILEHSGHTGFIEEPEQSQAIIRSFVDAIM